MTRNAFMDLETFSPVPLKNGTWAYAEKAEILLWAYALEEGPVKVWDIVSNPDMPDDLTEIVNNPDILIWWHNIGFDRTIIKNVMPEVHDTIDHNRWRCTMAQALAHALPGGLDALCEVLSIPLEFSKLKTGKELMRLFCIPPAKNVKRPRATRYTHPEKWEHFVQYAGNDVEAMREVYKRTPNWNYRGGELELFHLDQTINQRGFRVDLDLAESAIRAVNRSQKLLAARTVDLTNGSVDKATKRDKLLGFILTEYGIEIADLTKATIERLLQTDLPPVVKELLQIRLQAAGATATRKYSVVLRGASSDGRMRGCLQFDGASRTRRWSGRLFQPQNIRRPAFEYSSDCEGGPEKLAFGVEAMKADCEDLFFDNTIELASSATRGVIIPSPGMKLCVADLSNIEGRVAAWIAAEEWKIKAFNAYDEGTGPDLYRVTYAKSFGVDVNSVNKFQRQIGKTQELAFGYQGAVGAFLTFALAFSIDLDAMAEAALPSIPPDILVSARSMYEWSMKTKRSTYGLSEQTFTVCQAFVISWRTAHKKIAAFWREIEAAVVSATNYPGTMVECGMFKVRRDGSWLRILLPSGNYLCYPHPKVEDNKFSYMGAHTITRKWCRLNSYGGKIFENCIAADTLVLTEKGWIPIQSVSADLKVWDGVEWVSQLGAVSKGEQKVIKSFGVYMTEDHLVLTEQGWKNASSCERYNRFSCGLPYSGKILWFGWPKVSLGSEMSLWERGNNGRSGFLRSQKDYINLSAIKKRPDSESIKPVYDLMDCGPRNRFVVMDEEGAPLIVHNCCQALGRDFMAHAMPIAEKVGYRIILTVHDELVTEAPDTPEHSGEKLAEIMSILPPWAAGMPLAAAGEDMYAYHK